tara:strand:- start:76 stop:648 length:573 start_codon:yes stop_codon:yes gene_type:complete
MWALVNAEDNSIVEVISNAKTITINEVKHPKSIFTLWSESELNSIGLYTIVGGTTGDPTTQNTSDPSYAYNNSSKKVIQSYTITEKDIDAVKTNCIESVKIAAFEKMKNFGWMVQRVTMDSSKTIPSDVTKYCNDIRTDCSDIITSINNCTSTAQIRALHTDTVDSDGKVTEVARINRWSSDSAVTGYKR